MNKKKWAIFCPIKDENTFSPLWLKYYSQFLNKEDIYILDFNSRNIDYLDCNKIQTNKDIFDAEILFQEIVKTHRELLDHYEYVIPTDVDEFLFHPTGLDNYIYNLKSNNITACGYEIIHLPDKEPDYDSSKKIIEQRNFWYREGEWYDKTIITNKPLHWNIGLHVCLEQFIFDEKQMPKDKDLLLIHLHRFDYNTCIQRHLKYATAQWSEHTVANNFNWHYRENNIEKLNKWYFENKDKAEEIPETIKKLANF